MSRNMTLKDKYNPMSKEFQEEAKRLRLTGYQLMQKYKEEGKIVDIIDKERWNKTINNAGCKNLKEYQDKCAQNLGFKNRNDYLNNLHWENGERVPIFICDDSENYFGIYIGEELFYRFLLTVFEYVEKTPFRDGGIDFFCNNPKEVFINKYQQLRLEKGKKYKLQLRLRCLDRRNRGNDQWTFPIRYNGIVDYFLFSAWDNRNSMEPLHIWMIHRDEIIKGCKLWNRGSITITNNLHNLEKFSKYEIKEIDILREMYSILDK